MDFTGLNARRMVCEAARTDRIYFESSLNSTSIPSISHRTNGLHVGDFQRLSFFLIEMQQYICNTLLVRHKQREANITETPPQIGRVSKVGLHILPVLDAGAAC